jgi:MFS family permease
MPDGLERLAVGPALAPRPPAASRILHAPTGAANDNLFLLSGRARLWRIVGIMFLIGAEAVLYGYSYPFFTLALEKHGLANWLIGLNASFAGCGILLLGPFLPKLIDRFGLKGANAGFFAISLLSFVAILAADNLVVWFIARFVMGACFAALWTTTEIWLNAVVDDRHRGRMMGSACTLYAAAQFIGPLLLSATGAVGTLPLIVAMVPLAAGVIVALAIPTAGTAAPVDEKDASENFRLAISLAGPLIAGAFVAGLAETTMQSLLPVFGLSHGLTDAGASRLVATFSFGEAILVGLLGFLADRLGRDLTLRLCAVPAALTILLLAFGGHSGIAFAAAMFLAGGTISGVYTLGLILIGQDFRGQRLAIASTGFAMAYSAGAVVGSTPVGYAIDLFGPGALPVFISASFVAFIALVFLPRKRSRAGWLPTGDTHSTSLPRASA